MKKSLIYAIAVLAVTLTSVCGCSDKESVKERIARDAAFLHMTKVQDPVTVRVMTAGSENFETTTNYVGRIEPSKSTVVINQYSGVLEELNVTKGRRVSKGTVLAKISSESLQSAYDIAKSTLEQAEDGYARASQVYGTGSITEVKMVEIRTQLEKARAAERAARQALEDCIIKAPFTGVAGEIYCQKGERLTAAAPMVQLLDVESVEVHFNVPESEYSRLSVGDEAEVEIPALGRTVTGTVAVKGISASALSHSYDFILKGLSESASLMPGMVCKVRVRSEMDGGIVIPASAVMTDRNGRYIWGVSDDDLVCKTYVTVTGYADKGVVVSDGVAEGDRIIVAGSRKVSTGMKVKAEE